MIFLADVDDTLVRENTTYGFASRFLEATGRGTEAERVRRVHARRGVRGLGFALVHRMLGRDLARPFVTRALAGATPDRAGGVARSYVDGLLERAVVPATMALLEEARDAGGRVVLVSAGLDVVVSALASRLDAEHRSSVLEVDDGAYTGRLAVDLTGRKHEAVADLIRPGETVTVMTDNLLDRPLLERAGRRIVVLHRERDRHRWLDLDPEFLMVGPA